MFETLLPSARWTLLRALWFDGTRGSIHALARQNGLSYSSAHAELRRLERASLARSRVVGNATVFEAATDHPLAPAIEALVRASDDVEPPEEQPGLHQVVADLAALGAPLHTDTAPSADPDLEEAVAQGLRWAHRSPALTRAYPVLLARNRGRLDLERLRQRATELNEKQTLGFLLDLTGMLAHDRSLRAFARTLVDRRVKKSRDFFESPHGKYARRLADGRTPPVARDWHFRMNMDMDNFRSFFAKHFDPS